MANFCHDLLGKSGPCSHTSTIGILANVGEPGEKLVDQVAVGSVDFYQLESCLLGPFSSIAKFFYQLLDAITTQRLDISTNGRAGKR